MHARCRAAFGPGPTPWPERLGGTDYYAGLFRITDFTEPFESGNLLATFPELVLELWRKLPVANGFRCPALCAPSATAPLQPRPRWPRVRELPQRETRRPAPRRAPPTTDTGRLR
mmetsp:Transcript_3622/g.12806  ORF Transcript_3622/g.12806 Transcript_3622/m.12806 type:complete len:115 (-) Transcript_3622:25-369(-)